MKSFSLRALALSLFLCLGQMANAALTDIFEMPEWVKAGQDLRCNRAVEEGAFEYLSAPEVSQIYAILGREVAEHDRVVMVRLWERPEQRFHMTNTSAEFLAIVKVIRAGAPNLEGGADVELIKLRMKGDSFCTKISVVSGRPVSDLELGGGIERTGYGN